MKWKVLLGVTLTSVTSVLLACTAFWQLGAAAVTPGSLFAILLGTTVLAGASGWVVQGQLTGPMADLVRSMRGMAEGQVDLSRRLHSSNDEELRDFTHWFNAFVDRVHKMVTQLTQTSSALSRTADNLADSSRTASQGTSNQRQEIAQVASAVSQMSSTVQEVANNVATAATDAGNADTEANEGKQVVAETMDAIRALAHDIQRASDVISQLQKESENIGSVLDVIRGIAEQTNLLALNAAIEAARAGEQGRGFAVVADEVRTLASRTQSSTEEIHAMIERLQHGARDAVSVMEQGRRQAERSVMQAERAGGALAEITRAVSVIKDMTNQIAVASREQSHVTAEINRSINSISQVANATADGSKLNLQHCQSMVDLAKSVDELVTQFRV